MAITNAARTRIRPIRRPAAAANILQDKVGAAVAWLSAVVPGGRADMPVGGSGIPGFHYLPKCFAFKGV